MFAQSLVLCLVFQINTSQYPTEPSDRSWSENFTSAKELIAAGNYPEASVRFRAALDALAPFDVRDQRLAVTRSYLAAVSSALGRYGEAEAWLRQQLSILEATAGRKSPVLAGWLADLAGAYAAERKFAKAEEVCRRALDLMSGPAAAGSAMAAVLTTLGIVEEARGDTREAERLLLRSVSIAEALPPSEYGITSRGLLELAGLYRREGRLDKAGALAERSRRMLEMLFGPGHPTLFVPLEQIAQIHADGGSYLEAVATMQRAIAVAEKGFGANHPRIGRALVSEASWLRKLNRKPEAKALEERATLILDAAGPAEHSRTTVDVRDAVAAEGRTGARPR